MSVSSLYNGMISGFPSYMCIKEEQSTSAVLFAQLTDFPVLFALRSLIHGDVYFYAKVYLHVVYTSILG